MWAVEMVVGLVDYLVEMLVVLLAVVLVAPRAENWVDLMAAVWVVHLVERRD